MPEGAFALSKRRFRQCKGERKLQKRGVKLIYTPGGKHAVKRSCHRSRKEPFLRCLNQEEDRNEHQAGGGEKKKKKKKNERSESSRVRWRISSFPTSDGAAKREKGEKSLRGKGKQARRDTKSCLRKKREKGKKGSRLPTQAKKWQ